MATAREYLKELQAQYTSMELQVYSIDLSHGLAGMYRAHDAESGRIQEDHKARLASFFEKPKQELTNLDSANFYWYQLSQGLLRQFPADIADQLKRIPVGALPTRDANAMAIRASNGDPIVAVDSGLVNMLSFYNEMWMMAIALRTNPTLPWPVFLKQSWQFIVNYYLRSSMVNFPSRAVDIPLHHHIYSLSQTVQQEIFVLLHEYAHIYLGHMKDSTRLQLGPAADAGEQPERFTRTWEQEFEADALAFEWLALVFSDVHKNSTQDVKLASGLKSRVFSLYLFNLLHIVDLHRDDGQTSSSHPPAIERHRAILERCDAHLTPEERESAMKNTDYLASLEPLSLTDFPR